MKPKGPQVPTKQAHVPLYVWLVLGVITLLVVLALTVNPAARVPPVWAPLSQWPSPANGAQ
jgi:hypothetical protein